MNREQEWVLRIGGILLALISVAYGADQEEPLWQFAVPVVIVAGVVFVGLRTRTSAFEARGVEPSPAEQEIVRDIEALADMRRRELITEEDFARIKGRLLERATQRGQLGRSQA